jgi:DNA-binding NarL/FixJ family response regulator
VKTISNPHGGERIALVLTREQAERGEFGSALGLLFASRRPRLGFARIQQQVLEGAVDDLSDEEIADHLGLSSHAVNMRWRTIYERIDARPELAADIFHCRDRSQGEAGGGRKRRRVVAFVRAHPEELRPFAAATK